MGKPTRKSREDAIKFYIRLLRDPEVNPGMNLRRDVANMLEDAYISSHAPRRTMVDFARTRYRSSKLKKEIAETADELRAIGESAPKTKAKELVADRYCVSVGTLDGWLHPRSTVKKTGA